MNGNGWLYPLMLLLVPGVTGPLSADPIQKEPSQLVLANRRLEQGLQKEFDNKVFKMSLKEALGYIFEKSGEKVPILVDTEAFKEANADAPSIYDSQVIFPPPPIKITVEEALRIALSRVTPPNATYVLRRGIVEITTLEKASLGELLDENFVRPNFDRCPLDLALEELSVQTGATIIIDPRLGSKGRTPVTAHFLRPVALRTALCLLTEMAGVTIRHEDEVLFVTVPQKGGKKRALPHSTRHEARSNPPGLRPTTFFPLNLGLPWGLIHAIFRVDETFKIVLLGFHDDQIGLVRHEAQRGH